MARTRTAEQVTAECDLTDRVALVTGVNSGIGLETMRVLALRGARVIGTARTLEKARAACASVSGDTIPLACELTDQASVRQCADEIAAIGLDHLDIVVANAGIMALPELEQVDGIEKQFATNHLGHFLLINLLLPYLQPSDRNGGARIVIVSSAAHAQAPKAGIEFDNLSGERGYSGWRAYGHSKLANILFAKELARRLPEGCTANALHPGVIATNLGRHMQGPMTRLLGLVMWPFMISVEQGAATSCYLAAHPDADGISGEYFANCKPAKSSSAADDAALAARLWDVSKDLVGLA